MPGFLVSQIWDIAKSRVHNTFQGHTQEIYSLVFSSDGRLIVSGSEDHTTRIWDITDGSSKVFAITDVPNSVDAGVTSVAISSDGHLVAAGSFDTVRCFPIFRWMYRKCAFRRLYVFGMLVRVNCWRGYRDTRIVCMVWCSPLMHVG